MPIQFQSLHLQGSGGTAVPYERREGRNTLSTVATNPQDSLRLRRYSEHWRFYTGLQWNFQREDGEPLVTANYCRRIVDKKASFLVGRGINFLVPEPLTNITKPVVDEVWDYNNKDGFVLDMATMGGVTGDTFVMVTYEEPSAIKKSINPFTRGRVRLRLLGSEQVFPVWNPLNVEQIERIRIVTEVQGQGMSTDGSTQTVESTPITMGGLGVTQNKRYIEDIYPDRIVEGWDGEERTTRRNDLGEIPVVHISNQSFPREYYGLSDLDGIIDIQREYNEKLTDISDIVNYHAAPVTVILGARAKQLDKGPKSLWSGLPADAKVFNLELGGNLAVSHEYLKTVQQIMFDLAGLPEGSLGRTQPISNTSAAALQVQFQPLVEAVERKLPSFKKGLEQINYLILRYYQLATGISFPVDLCKHCGGRIVEVQEDGVSKRQCFTIDPQTLQFLSPEDVQVSIKRTYSFGSETRKVPFSQAIREHKKASTSFWDPEPEVDLQQKAEDDQERSIAAEDWQTAAQDSYEQNERTLKKEEEPPKEVDEDGNALSPEIQDQVADIPQPPEPMPPELEPPVEVEPEQLSPHDIDIPEEPVTIQVTVMTWDAQTQQFVKDNLGVKTLVPTGCISPVYLNPYETSVEIKSALPRDRERDSNLYAQWQQNGWLDRHHIMKRLEIGENPIEVDKAIADDIPFLLAIQGKQDPTQQVAQTPGMQPNQPGDNHGAPLPPGPGPGRGNRFVPGDDLA